MIPMRIPESTVKARLVSTSYSGGWNGTVFTAQDGGFDSESELVADAEIDVSGWEIGLYQLGVRYKDRMTSGGLYSGVL